MPTQKPSGQPKTRITKATKPMTARQVWARTQLLAEVLLSAMESAIDVRDEERSEQWVKLFGCKDSALVHLQKMVNLLADLQQQRPPQRRTAAKVQRADEDEMAMLVDWVRCRDASAANVSPAAE